MKKIALITATLLTILFISCDKDDDVKEDPVADVELENEINGFIWRGLNEIYLWNADVPNLADAKKDDINAFNTYLNSFTEPESTFEALIYDRDNTDKWSWIVDDYVALEQQFQGVSKSNGVDFQLVRLSGSDDLFAYVKLILPNSDASNKSIKRGDFFMEVDGQQLTLSNYRDLLFGASGSYTLGMGTLSNNTIGTNGVTIPLTKSVYTENPIFITKTFNISGKKIGYLMYNSFTSNFDQQLNDAFGQLKSEGVTDLVLDFRYNGGGSITTSTYLASMITGQFTGQLFIKERWNAKYQAAFEARHPDWLIDNFPNEIIKKDSNGKVILQESINSLNLSKVYVLVSDKTASASELIINGLNPYIDVKLVGTKTVGKYVGSVTLYDSSDFGRDGANSNHKYAMQPIVLEEVNKLGKNDKDGFDPHIIYEEDLVNLGVLGEINEPLLSKAISDITGGISKEVSKKQTSLQFEIHADSRAFSPLYNEMYVDFKNKQ